MAGGIFISYRRDDAKHAAGRLVDRLAKTYARSQLFMDVDGIEPGLDFERVLSEKVEACDVLLAVIGPGWLDAKDSAGTRRLDKPDDFVRIEIAAALARDVRVIPLLVDGARMPTADQLPEPLKQLARRQATRLAHEQFGSDTDTLIANLTRLVAPIPSIVMAQRVNQAIDAQLWLFATWILGWIAGMAIFSRLLGWQGGDSVVSAFGFAAVLCLVTAVWSNAGRWSQLRPSAKKVYIIGCTIPALIFLARFLV